VSSELTSSLVIARVGAHNLSRVTRIFVRIIYELTRNSTAHYILNAEPLVNNKNRSKYS
jgi:hypothetical protein